MKTTTVGLVILTACLAACTPSDAKRPETKTEATAQAPAQAPVQASAPATSASDQAPVPGTFTETDQPITAPTWSSCIVVIDLFQQAIKDGKAQGVAGAGDLASLAAADTEFRARLKAAMPVESEQQQLIGSSVAFFDELTPAQLKASVDLCLVQKATIAADNV